jgi:hypothetical protein
MPGMDPAWIIALSWGWWWTLFVAGLVVAAARGVARIPANCWPPIGAVGLAGVMGYHAVVGYLADTRTWAEIAAPPMWTTVIGIVWWLFVVTRPVTVAGRGRNRITARRTLTGRTMVTAHYSSRARGHAAAEGRPWKVCRHEAGHGAMAEWVRGSIVEARVYAAGGGRFGGWCSARLPGRPTLLEQVINYGVFIVGGEVAVHSREGCGHDQANLDRALGYLPAGQRDVARREIYARARNGCAARAGRINYVARRLQDSGVYHGSATSPRYFTKAAA